MVSSFNPCIMLIGTDEFITRQGSADLRETGYQPVNLNDVNNALKEYRTLKPAMIIIDRVATAELGIEFCQELRLQGEKVFIIMLLPEETLEERVLSLEAGADDYFIKPYNTQGFLKLISFYLQQPDTVKEQLRFGDMVLDLSCRRLFLKNTGIDLTMKEFELLRYMMVHPKEVLTREQILENVWGYDFQGESNVIEVYVRYLRLKMEAGGNKRLIHTVRGVGYVLREG
ncbi:MAG: Response regulator MprA [Chroococcopsis gigantea SAG 12.99]|jgi:OmpR family response regulator NblR|nr:response regulator transcription factor [Chlorogloea purpurea SAG 13.99]MDV2998588.1 Response regulator MprA [Chroococcopsis gigantea SAG 12.99]